MEKDNRERGEAVKPTVIPFNRRSFGEKKLNISQAPYFQLQELDGELRQWGARLLDIIDRGCTPPRSFEPEQVGEHRRLTALAVTSIQQGILWAIEANNMK